MTEIPETGQVSCDPIEQTETQRQEADTKSPFPSIPDEYYRRILGLLETLEKTHGIKILYAVENGSRMQGNWHDGSDCDIRFIFKYTDKILNTGFGRKIMKKSETIEGFSEDKMLDWQGWGIEKAIEAISHSNPSMIEFLYSSICYLSVGDFHTDCLKIVEKMHNSRSLYYHYLNMAKKNWKEHIIDQDGQPKANVIYKKYLYVLRPLFMVMYITSPLYPTVKDKRPIINDFNELLDTVRALYPMKQKTLCAKVAEDQDNDDAVTIHTNQPINKSDEPSEHDRDPCVLNPRMLIDLSLVVRMKKTDKTHEGPGLKDLNLWISDFFNNEEERERMNGETARDEKKETVIFQAINATKCKLTKEIEKINALSTKNDQISRNDYISLFNQYLLFMWLIQHPEKHAGNASPNSIELLDQIKIDEELREWIRQIMVTTEGFENKEGQEYERKQRIRKMIVVLSLTEMAESLAMIESEKDPLFLWVHEKIKEYEKTGKVPDDNIIDLFFKSQLSLLWLLKNDTPGRRMPPQDILADKDTQQVIPKVLLDKTRRLINDLRPKYVCPVNLRFHGMIQEDVRENDIHVKDAVLKHARKKEIVRQQMYRNAVVEIDPREFIDLMAKYY